MLYLFTRRDVLSPGTGDLAFQPLTTLPAFKIGGPGTEYTRGMKPIGEPQLYYGQSQILDGLAGTSFAGMDTEGAIDFDAYLSNLMSAAGE